MSSFPPNTSTQPTVSPLPVDQITQDLDDVSLNSYSTTDSNDRSIASDFDREIDEITKNGKFFEHDLFDDTVLDGVDVSYHTQTPHCVRNDNEYISSIDEVSGLHVRKPKLVFDASQKGPLSLF